MHDISTYMKTRNINQHLQIKIKRYIEYMHNEE